MTMQMYEEASEWLVQHRSHALDEESRRRFDAWLRQSPDHLRAYLEMSSVWEGVGEMDPALNLSVEELIARVSADSNVVALAEHLPPAAESRVRQTSEVTIAGNRRRPRTLRALLGLVAVLALVVGAFQLTSLLDTYSTAIGEQLTVTLPDGSSIELNARSKVRVEYEQQRRVVNLLQGQALFRVAKDAKRPFVVYSDGSQVRAVGTQFDVYKNSTGTVVTVVEGRVAVLSSSAQSESARQGPLGGGILLGAGEQLVIAENVQPVPKSANIEAATGWTEQRLVFDFAPLTYVAEEFNRYNRRRLVIDDRSLESFNISGTFSSTDPTVLLQFLRVQPGISVTETQREIRISRQDTPLLSGSKAYPEVEGLRRKSK